MIGIDPTLFWLFTVIFYVYSTFLLHDGFLNSWFNLISDPNIYLFHSFMNIAYFRHLSFNFYVFGLVHISLSLHDLFQEPIFSVCTYQLPNNSHSSSGYTSTFLTHQEHSKSVLLSCWQSLKSFNKIKDIKKYKFKPKLFY